MENGKRDLKEGSPLKGWVIVLMGARTLIGRPKSPLAAVEVLHDGFTSAGFELKPVFELDVIVQVVPHQTPQGPVGVPTNARVLRPISALGEIDEITVPPGASIIDAEVLSGKDRQEFANIIENTIAQLSAAKSNILMIR